MHETSLGVLRHQEGGGGPDRRRGPIGGRVALSLVAPSEWRPEPRLDDERRTYLALTDLGRQGAGAETDRLASLVAHAKAAGLGGTAG
jgi:hypothetical protein